MTEPTIDEMLDWLDQWEGDNGRVAAIRAILEQHRPMERGKGLLLMHPNDIDRGKLEAIRAFVERVRGAARRDSSTVPEMDYEAALNEELAKLEAE